MNTLAERIESVRKSKGLSKTDIWKSAGLTSGVYSQWMNGQSLTGENLLKVATILGVDPNWLQTGKEDKNKVNVLNEFIETNVQIINAESVELPLMNATPSMGNGNEAPDHEIVIDVLRVTKSWVNKTLSSITSIQNLAFIHAIGDSMHPTFNDGDILLVDCGAINVKSDNIYVLEAHERLFIKRVRQRLDGSFEISSDNPAVKTVDTLNGDHQVTVKGRVVFIWNGKRV